MDWFDKNSTALITAGAAIVSAVLAATVAFISSWISNKQNTQRTELQFAHEAVKIKKELMIQKGEELFTALDKWLKSCYESNTNFIFSITEGEVHHSEKDESKVINEVYTRANTLVAIYFPMLEKDFNEISDTQVKATVTYACYLTNQTDKNKAAISIHQTNSLVIDKARVFRENLANEIKKFI
ncbi:hypothetical protein GKC68_10605 [Pantoea sp. RSPAM1]|uniref:hypothetical protein n=1 Tax=Pantoea sp. RSPAM1 TaxID=2675223 RepID=UPI00315DC8FF